VRKVRTPLQPEIVQRYVPGDGHCVKSVWSERERYRERVLEREREREKYIARERERMVCVRDEVRDVRTQLQTDIV